ncbi:uncharacterized protein LOC116340425 [Contarinia nasturtii]|uniref:uncharacterized protein LOC116340425 n=1 Tax=Contarinia nasturtii TaxID=265458 RepID=UPI0012D3EA85|nr:uncharacterized protein LOC116340425 [Contarinia nasturtii]
MKLITAVILLFCAKISSCLHCNCELGVPRNYSGYFNEPTTLRRPWSVIILQFGYERCYGVIVSNTHILTTEDCIIPYKGKPANALEDYTYLPRNFWIPYTEVKFNSKLHIKVKTVFIHPDLNSFQSKIAIVELKEAIRLDEYKQAAFLPREAVNVYGARTTVGLSHDVNGGFLTTEKINAFVWSKEICSLFNNGDEDSLMCIDIDDDCSGCNLCPGILNQALFHVKNDVMELLALPRYCKTVSFNESTYMEEIRTVHVYFPIGNFIPWIQHILSKRCGCSSVTSPIIEGKDAIVF